MIRINPRERRTLMVAGCFLVALLIYLLIVSPYLKAMEVMDRQIVRKSEELKEVLALQQDYFQLKEKTKMLENMVRSTPGFSLLSFLENLATRNQIKNQIAYMKPVTAASSERYRESSVEMKIENITLKQLIDYLYGIEQSRESIRVKRLNIVKKKETDLLDVTLQASTFELLASTAGG